MNTDIYELAAKALIGEKLTVEEKTRLQKRNAKYELVRFLYMEKMADAGLKDFQFTPGDGFETIPTIDIVNTLLNINEQLKDAKAFSFGDGSWDHNIPKTGRKKRKLGE